MISSLLLLLTWIRFLGLSGSGFLQRSPLLLPVTFFASQAFLFLIYFLLIFFGTSPIASLILLTYALLLTFTLLADSSQIRFFFSSFRRYFFFEDTTPDSFDRQGLPPLLLFLEKTRVFILSVFFPILLVISLLMSSPKTWDVYTYNVARIPHMLLMHSPFLLHSPSLPQALFPLGHDLLYYPDILRGNIMGLGAISSMEYILVVGCALNLCSLLIQPSSKYQFYRLHITSMFVVSCLMLSSSQHLRQATMAKNDLVSALIITISLLAMLIFSASPKTEKREVVIQNILLLLFIPVWGYILKAYGLFSAVPLLISLFITMASFKNPVAENCSPGLSMPSTQSSSMAVGRGLQLSGISSPRLRSTRASLFLLVISISLFAVAIAHYSFTYTNYFSLPDYRSSVSNYVANRHSLWEIIVSGLLNIARYLVNLLAYPFSTLLKYGATKQDDYFLGISPIVKFLDKHDLGIAPGYGYGLVRYTNDDSVLAGTGFHVVLAMAAISTIFILAKGGSNFRKYLEWIKSSLNTRLLTLLILAACINLLVICSLFAYHNWFPKYLGFFLICLYPIISAILAANLSFISISSIKTKRSREIMRKFLLASLAMFIASTVFIFVSDISGNFGYLYNPRDAENKYKMYYDYLNSVGITTVAERKQLLDSFAQDGIKKKIVCFGEETPTLAPLLELMKNSNAGDSLVFKPIKDTACQGTGPQLNGYRRIVLP